LFLIAIPSYIWGRGFYALRSGRFGLLDPSGSPSPSITKVQKGANLIIESDILCEIFIISLDIVIGKK